jgi:nicotinamidase-related amidase
MGQVLLLVDIQNDYFPGGAMELSGMAGAAARAAGRPERVRARGLPVIHVRHVSLKPGAAFFLPGTPGVEIHAGVAPRTGESVVEKHFPTVSAARPCWTCCGSPATGSW